MDICVFVNSALENEIIFTCYKSLKNGCCLFERTADPPLILLDDLQQLHACSLDGVEDLQSRRKSALSTNSNRKRLVIVEVILS